MAAPETTTWPIEPHTRAKHEILKRYLQAWVAILGRASFPRLLYIDGFAGPGRYAGGEEGSPLIALRAAVEQDVKTPVEFLFVERDKDWADALQRAINAIPRDTKRFRVEVACGREFAEVVTDLLQGGALPPTFAFIDPFGWKGVPFSIIQRIMSYPRCEVLVTFMYEEINRFLGQVAQPPNFDVFFGTPEWRKGLTIVGRQRNRFLHDIYATQLRTTARYVRSFEMRNERDVTDYYLFYATSNLLGLKRMKAAMWDVDRTGEFRFSDATNPDQLTLFGDRPDFDALRRQVVERFHGREATVREVEEFVLAETAFRETHYKQHVLRVLELAEPPQLEVLNAPAKRRRGTYGDPSLRLRFV